MLKSFIKRTLTGEMGSVTCFFLSFIGAIGGWGLNLGTYEEGIWRWRTKPRNIVNYLKTREIGNGLKMKAPNGEKKG